MSPTQDRQKTSWKHWAFLASPCVLTMLMLCAFFYYRPRQQVLFVNPNYVGTYYGFGTHEQPGFFGKNWTSIRVDERPFGWWEVDLAGNTGTKGYFPYRGYYASGSLMEEGVCMDEFYNSGEPTPDRSQVLHGKYSDPTGKLIGEETEQN